MTVLTTYLEMLSPAALRAKTNPDPAFQVAECRVKNYAVNRFLYEFVGAAWHWTDLLTWSDERWQAYAEAPNLRTWLATYEGSPAGYYELQKQADTSVKIAYFGLAQAYIGRGWGGYFLSHAVQSAWDWGTHRVWVHTCSQDHPAALSNYQARGFTIYHSVLSGAAGDPAPNPLTPPPA